MTLDEAIKHAEEVADAKLQDAELSEIQGCYRNAKKCVQCAEEHRQLAEWLKELKLYREIFGQIEFEHIGINFEPIDIEKRLVEYNKTLYALKHVDLGEV